MAGGQESDPAGGVGGTGGRGQCWTLSTAVCSRGSREGTRSILRPSNHHLPGPTPALSPLLLSASLCPEGAGSGLG